MSDAAEKWRVPEEVVKEVPVVPEVEAVPLGGEGNDVVVDLNAEREAREGVKKASEQAKLDTQVAAQRARENLSAIDPEGPIVHRKQWMENAPTTPIPHGDKPGEMLNRRELAKDDGPLTKFMNWLFRRGEKK